MNKDIIIIIIIVIIIIIIVMEGPEGVKWELGLACFCPGEMGFKSLELGFGHWEWGKNVKNGNGINIL